MMMQSVMTNAESRFGANVRSGRVYTHARRRGIARQAQVLHARRDGGEDHAATTSTRRGLIGAGGCLATYLMGGPGFCGWEAWAEEVAADDLVPVSKLSKPARQFQYQQLLQFIKKSVVNNVTADYKQVLQLAFLDALTYDKGTKSGGANGSVRFEDIGELKGVLEQVSKAKDDFEKSYPAPIQISWADMIVMSGYFKLKEHFAKTILDRAQDSQGGQVILNAYGNDVPVPPLGRVDAESADALKLAKGVEDVAKRAMEAGLISGQVVALAVAFPGEASIEEVEEKVRGKHAQRDTHSEWKARSGGPEDDKQFSRYPS